MSENRHSHHQHGVPPHRGHEGHGDGPYWKRAHHDWRFWVALFLMFVAIMVYVMTQNLAWRPRRQAQQPPAGAVGK